MIQHEKELTAIFKELKLFTEYPVPLKVTTQVLQTDPVKEPDLEDINRVRIKRKT